MSAFSWLGPLRDTVRHQFFELLQQSLQTDEGRRILAAALSGVVESPEVAGRRWSYEGRPYPELGVRRATSSELAPVFTTGRFRSAPTLFWKRLRHGQGAHP